MYVLLLPGTLNLNFARYLYTYSSANVNDVSETSLA